MTKKIADEDLLAHFDAVGKKFKGQVNELEQAVGMLVLSRLFGWKVMLLMHDRKTIAKYEKLLGIDIRKQAPEVGPYAHKSVAWIAVQKVSNFWKAVKGEIPGIRSPDIR